MAKKILICDDSALMRRLISDIINSDKRFEVKDLACNGLEGLDLIVKNHADYDCVILDINMPKMNGLELLEQLQKNRIKITVLMVSTLTKEGANETIIALERGALDFVTKPENYIEAKGGTFKERLLEKLCMATGIDMEEPKTAAVQKKTDSTVDFGSLRVSKNTNVASPMTGKLPGQTTKNVYKPHKSLQGSKAQKRKLVALACSTGGPRALQSVIPRLPAEMDAPMVLVQHMPKGFTNSLAQRLNDMSKVNVKEAADGDVLKKGWVYIAPGGTQMRINKQGNDYVIVITNEPARGGLKPCADIMYESLMESSFDEITCVVLTGMGADGTVGIGQLGEKNTIYVISQDAASSVVYGMPKAVAEAKLSDEVQPLEQIAEAIIKNVGVLNNGR
ncbi:MAG: chemotaxis-specific protein-glutamate methyltransferase CheB [Lachnospiraceae bacterium]